MRTSMSLSKSKSENKQGSTLAIFWAPGRDCTENRGLLVALALLEVRAKLVEQANYQAFCENAVAHSVFAAGY